MSKITRADFERQTDHVAVIAHGAHPEYRLEIDAPISIESGASGAAIRQGSVVSLNTSGAYVLGIGSASSSGSAVNYPVPAISLKNANDPDVTAGTGDLANFGTSSGTDYRKITFAAVGGNITAIPCTGGYEIETTEFDKSATYRPGDALTASAGDVVLASTPAYATSGSAIIGFVSHVPQLNKTAGAKVLGFLTSFIPQAL